MGYLIYRTPPSSSQLYQGDILDASVLRDALRGHQDYFADRPRFSPRR